MDEASLHELLSGRKKGLGAHVIRSGLRVGAWAYGAATVLRNLGYDHHWLSIQQATVPVISIGNITTGGTGKTPFAAWLANWLTTAGRKPGLLSRGYRSLERESSSAGVEIAGNDEKLVLDRLCPNVPHLQQKDRVSSARRAVALFGCDVLLLDDGFQHRRLHRDLDLVLIDSLQPFGYGHLLPRGLLRERQSGLRRADVIVLTRVDQCSQADRQLLREELRRIRGTDECVEVAFTPQRLVDLNWQPQPLSLVAGKKAFAFCGIGNPAGFRRTLESIGSNCKTIQTFPDHHHYDQSDLTGLARRANDLSADFVLTTQKDLVKMSPDAWSGPALFAVEIGLEFKGSEPLLVSHLETLIARP